MKPHLPRLISLFIFQVVLSIYGGHAQGIFIESGSSVVANGSVYIVLNNAGFKNDGTFAAATGTLSFTGSTATSNSFIAGSGAVTFNNLELNKTVNGIQLNKNIGIANSILFTAGDSIYLNNNNITLGSSAILSGETNTKRITGQNGGYIEIVQILDAPSAINPGNLGMELSSTADLGSTLIRRGHHQQSGISIYRFYDISPSNNSGLNATVTFHYLDPELAGISEGNLGIFSSSNAGISWSKLGQDGQNIVQNTVTKNAVNQLNRLMLSNINYLLALRTLYLKARSVHQQSLLSWSSTAPSNIDHFDIERSADGRQFISIASVTGSGNGSKNQNYEYTDPHPFTGINYYRLKQVDNDKQWILSEIVSLNPEVKENGLLSLYPNPAVNIAMLSFHAVREEDYLFQITAMNGKIIQAKKIHCLAGLNEFEWDMSLLRPGIYTIKAGQRSLRSLQFLKK